MSISARDRGKVSFLKFNSLILVFVFILSGCAGQSIGSLEEIKTVCLKIINQDINDTDKSKDFLSGLGSELAIIRANDPETAAAILSLVDDAEEQVRFIQNKALQLRLELGLNKASATETIEEMNKAHKLIDGIENDIEASCLPFLRK
jgi:peptidoglycan hydrolase CwlO-like protein